MPSNPAQFARLPRLSQIGFTDLFEAPDLFVMGKFPDNLPARAAYLSRYLGIFVAKVTDSGSHYFDEKTLKWFNARLVSIVDGRFLVESVRDASEPREYRVVWFERPDDTAMYDHHRTRSFNTLVEATRAAQWLANTYRTN